MSRCTQDFGFGTNNPINQEELENLECVEYAREGMFDDCPLFEYRFGDKVIYYEVVQYSPWSSGPMLFKAFKRVLDQKMFSYWTPKDANEACGEDAVSDELNEMEF